MNPADILAQLNLVLTTATTTFFSQLQFDSGSHQEQPPSQPVQVPVMPVPFAGELSYQFNYKLFELDLPDKSAFLPPNLKWDPWYVQSGPDGFTRGAWIPVEATFTQPVG